jgi:transcriptional regulator with XRE-family HTH domain
MPAVKSKFMPFFLWHTRIRLGMTQKAFAKGCGCTQSAISKIENSGKHLPLWVERAANVVEVKHLVSSYEANNWVGERVRRKRWELGMTQEALAKAIGCTRSAISKIESSEKTSPVVV